MIYNESNIHHNLLFNFLATDNFGEEFIFVIIVKKYVKIVYYSPILGPQKKQSSNNMQSYIDN